MEKVFPEASLKFSGAKTPEKRQLAFELFRQRCIQKLNEYRSDPQYRSALTYSEVELRNLVKECQQELDLYEPDDHSPNPFNLLFSKLLENRQGKFPHQKDTDLLTLALAILPDRSITLPPPSDFILETPVLEEGVSTRKGQLPDECVSFDGKLIKLSPHEYEFLKCCSGLRAGDKIDEKLSITVDKKAKDRLKNSIASKLKLDRGAIFIPRTHFLQDSFKNKLWF